MKIDFLPLTKVRRKCMIRLSTMLLWVLTCQSASAQKTFTHNDTLEIINIALTQAFDSARLPDLSGVTRQYKFGDSILFTSQSIKIKFLPKQFKNLHFKILNQPNICQLLLADTDFMARPNYLSIQTFERKGNSFTIIIVSHNCDKFVSGGGLHLEIKKEGTSFRITYRSSYSMG